MYAVVMVIIKLPKASAHETGVVSVRNKSFVFVPQLSHTRIYQMRYLQISRHG